MNSARRANHSPHPDEWLARWAVQRITGRLVWRQLGFAIRWRLATIPIFHKLSARQSLPLLEKVGQDV